MTANTPTVERIANIIGNRPLATSIHQAIAAALRSKHVHLAAGRSVKAVFEESLNAAVRDIEKHPHGKLFRRLIEFGPRNPGRRRALSSDGKGMLSDPECETCVEFIFSHMVNRFKGELAELLALRPSMALVRQLQLAGRLPADVSLFWGNAVQERAKRAVSQRSIWSGFVKGADGMLACCTLPSQAKSSISVKVHGVIEIKSMLLPRADLVRQIDSHIRRCRGGVKLGEAAFPGDGVCVQPKDVLRIMIVPSTWKLSRDWRFESGDHGETRMVFPEPVSSPEVPQMEECRRNLWRITLDWSEEALEQAAYEMTFWYMSRVGAHVYAHKPLPKGWEYMTPDEAGYNAIKMMLYYMPLRPLSKRQQRLAVRLYNVYSFGYPVGVDSRQMLWGPLVGIVWLHGRKVFAFDTPAGEVTAANGTKAFPFTHDEKWKDLRRRHTSLKGIKPSQLRRGRVTYSVGEREYQIWLPSECCGDRSLIDRIVRRFQLPPSQTKVLESI